jgi:hypothetical protein
MPVSIPPPTGQEAGQINQWLELFNNLIKIAGGFVAGYYVHVLRSKSAKAGRRRDFLAFMKAWRHEIERRHFVIGGWERHAMVYMDGISAFLANAETIAGDFTAGSRMQFDDLVAVVPKFNPHDTDKILKALDDVIYYVKNAA